MHRLDYLRVGIISQTADRRINYIELKSIINRANVNEGRGEIVLRIISGGISTQASRINFAPLCSLK